MKTWIIGVIGAIAGSAIAIIIINQIMQMQQGMCDAGIRFTGAC